MSLAVPVGPTQLYVCVESHASLGAQSAVPCGPGGRGISRASLLCLFPFLLQEPEHPLPHQRPLFRSLSAQLLLVITVEFWFCILTPFSFSSYLFNIGDAFWKISSHYCTHILIHISHLLLQILILSLSFALCINLSINSTFLKFFFLLCEGVFF